MAEFSWLDKGKLNRRDFLKGLGLTAGMVALGTPRLLHAQEPIVIGAPSQMGIFVGEGNANGVAMAIEELNAAGGVLGRMLKMEVADTEGNPAVAKPAVEELVVSKGAQFLIGLFRSEAMMGVLPSVARLKVPLLITGATFPAATQQVAEDYETYKYVFRPMVNGNFLAMHLLEFSADYLAGFLVPKGLLPSNKVVIVSEDLLWTKPLEGLLQQMLPQFGLDVVGAVRIAVGTTDYAPIFQQMGDAAMAITAFSAPEVAIPFVAAWATAQVPIPLFGINAPFQGPEAFTATQGLAEGIVQADVGAGADVAITFRSRPFHKAYVAKYGKAPVYTASIGYDSVYLLADAITRAGTTAADAVVAALEATDWTGASGQIQFYGENPAAEDPKYGPYAFRHDSKYGPTLIYPVEEQLDAQGNKAVLWPLVWANGSFLLPPWMRG
ncbi:MAG: ABC transporter substrate-binding protein [Candidatus Bipolaricaulia bacterium]